MKKNGFSCPLHWQQVLTWVLFSMNIIFYFLFTQSLLVNGNAILISILFGIFSFLVCLVGLIATKIDPTDNMCKMEMKKRKNSEKQNGKYVLEISKKYDFCVLCCSNVDSSSKHCKICDRCVDHFDHHCNWLNNCIGRQNYSYFFTLLIFVLINLIYFVSINFYAFSIYINKSESEEKKMIEVSDKLGVTPILCATISFILAIINIAIIGNISYLIIIQIWLRCHGLTTYEYIVKNYVDEGNDEKKNKPNDQSEDIMLKVNQNSPLKKKGRNKVIPDELIDKLKNMEQNFKVKNDIDKIIINEQDFNNKIFKPIVENIYSNADCQKNINETHQTTPGRNTNNFNNLNSNINNSNHLNSTIQKKPHRKTINYPTQYPYPKLSEREKEFCSSLKYNGLNNVSNNSNNIPSIERMRTKFDGHT